MDHSRLTKIRRRVHRQWAALAEKRTTVSLTTRDRLEHLIDAWHEDPDNGQPLHDYLGMNWEQYGHWVAGRGVPAGWVPPNYEIKKTDEGNSSMITPTIPAAAVEPVTGGVDKDGFIDLSHLRGDYAHLQELKKQRTMLNEAIKVYEDKFKAPIEAVEGATGFKVDGLPRYRYERNGTFPHAEYAKQNPGIAAAFQTTKTVFDVAAFKATRPLEYERWRSQRFVEISETKKG